MGDLVVRRLLVDLETPIPARWNGGDAFRTALFDALSFSFPAGEQFFIDSVRAGAALLDGPARERWDAELRGFVGQEATHRRIHERVNAHLERRGLVNGWQRRIARRLKRLDGLHPRAGVGATAATEHLTAVLAAWLLRHDASALSGTEPRLRELWLWHASEELEHRSTAFELYRALGGGEPWRRRLFWIVSGHFAVDLAIQVWDNLGRDGARWRWSTWRSAVTTLFGREGLVRCHAAAWFAYRRRDFDPSRTDGEAGRRWLAEHAGLAPPVHRAR